MKNKILLVLMALSLTSVAHAEMSCEPTGVSNWKTASVDHLQNAATWVWHVRAQGIFVVADLICDFRECVGFVNGIKAEGALEQDDRGNVVSVTIYGDRVLHTVKFHCTPQE